MKKVSTGMKILSVVLGTVLGGFIWRCRGESGFGSSWGMYSVALVLILLIYHFYADKKNMRYEMIPIGALLAGLGVTGYATVIEQLAGLVYSDLPFGGPDPVNLPVSPYSGAIIIFLMGLTLVPLYSFFIGTLFSEKDYKISNYIIAIVIFFGVSYIAKATVAHPIMKLINPEQVKLAALGLKEAGYDYSSPMQAYMIHFGQRRWTQDIAFFENYYMSVEHISDVFGVIALAVYPIIAFKDKTVTKVSLFIDVVTSVITTSFSPLISVVYGTGFFENVRCPDVLAGGAGWGLWEYVTGAGVGFSTMLIIALLPDRLTAQSKPDTSPLIKNPTVNFIFNFAATVFIFGVVPFRIIGIRAGKFLNYMTLCEDGETIGTIALIVASVIFGLCMLKKLYSNYFSKRIIFSGTPEDFARTAFPAYIAMCGFAYLCLNHGYIFVIPYSEMKSFSDFISIATGAEHCITFLMIISFLLIFIMYIPAAKKLKKH